MVSVAKTIYVNSSSMAKIMNLGSPKGIPIIPITIIDIKTINTWKLGFLINDLILINYKSIIIIHVIINILYPLFYIIQLASVKEKVYISIFLIYMKNPNSKRYYHH